MDRASNRSSTKCAGIARRPHGVFTGFDKWGKQYEPRFFVRTRGAGRIFLHVRRFPAVMRTRHERQYGCASISVVPECWGGAEESSSSMDSAPKFPFSSPLLSGRSSIMTSDNTYRKIPGVDTVIKEPRVAELAAKWGTALVTFAVRREIAEVRRKLRGGKAQAASMEEIVKGVEIRVRSLAEPSLRQVINATGVVLHTNLGRAPLGETVGQSLFDIIVGYTNLEFDLSTGRRGHRISHIRDLLRYLTGAEDAVVVNNNAAGIILTLNTLAADREVIVSRGELIEIGGAFRIPEIMAAGGARMVEVGTTNRTRVTDYEKAITDHTALLFKAHQSNYTITGFTEEASVRELAQLARAHGIPFVYDLGSGLLRKPEGLPLGSEPDVRGALADGADLVMFSCDKLLGGPQAGIVAGNADLVNRLAQAPLMRALRVGKLTFAALSAACRNYLTDGALVEGNPTFRMLRQRPEKLKGRARDLMDALRRRGIEAEIVESGARCGGGTLPNLTIPSYGVSPIAAATTIKEREAYAEMIHKKLLRCDPPVLAVLREGRLVIDVFTLSASDTEYVAEAVAGCRKESC
ncbi:MAG: L-seryl-tRNA(Sec) selenium transferase [Chitinivibrionales bacterium]|nr:L-seryl-tRNA(Sec) selenium transferase [Chitinivibrionales bacterium]MBD3356435.1 L-seryl-tRNA(Sec) selenium transferase [Chitinivibrionales bacterium]